MARVVLVGEYPEVHSQTGTAAATPTLLVQVGQAARSIILPSKL